MSDVGAVILNYHREADAARLVADLTEAHGVDPDNVVVVDNGSAEKRLADELASRGCGPTVLAFDNIGYSAGMNAGVRALPAEVDVVLLLTHEVRLGHRAVEQLAATVRATPRSVVAPLLIEDSGRIWSAGGALTAVRSLPRHDLHGHDVDSVPQTLHSCAWVDGAVVATSRVFLDDLGGLDERYFLYSEDIDLGLRAHKAGGRVAVLPWVTAQQAPSGNIDPFLWTRNTFLLFAAHRRWLAWLLWLASCVVGIVRDVVLLRAREEQVPRRLQALAWGLAGRNGPPPR